MSQSSTNIQFCHSDFYILNWKFRLKCVNSKVHRNNQNAFVIISRLIWFWPTSYKNSQKGNKNVHKNPIFYPNTGLTQIDLIVLFFYVGNGCFMPSNGSYSQGYNVFQILIIFLSWPFSRVCFSLVWFIFTTTRRERCDPQPYHPMQPLSDSEVPGRLGRHRFATHLILVYFKEAWAFYTPGPHSVSQRYYRTGQSNSLFSSPSLR